MSLFCIRKTTLYFFFSGWWGGISCYILQFCRCRFALSIAVVEHCHHWVWFFRIMLCMKTAIYQQLDLCNAAFFPQVLVAIIDRYVARLELEAFNLLNLRSDWKDRNTRRWISDGSSAGALLSSEPSLIPQSRTFFLVIIIPPPTQHSAEPPTQHTTTHSAQHLTTNTTHHHPLSTAPNHPHNTPPPTQHNTEPPTQHTTTTESPLATKHPILQLTWAVCDVPQDYNF